MTCTWFCWLHHKGMKTMKTMKISITLPHARRVLVRSQQWPSEAKDCLALGWEAAPNAGGQAMSEPKIWGLPCAMLAVLCVYVCITLGSSLVFPPQLFQSTKSEDCWLNTMRLYTKICRYMRYMQYYTQCCKKTADPKPLQSAVSCCSSSSAYFLMSTRKHDFSVWPFWRLLAPCHFFPEWMTWSQWQSIGPPLKLQSSADLHVSIRKMKSAFQPTTWVAKIPQTKQESECGDHADVHLRKGQAIWCDRNDISIEHV